MKNTGEAISRIEKAPYELSDEQRMGLGGSAARNILTNLAPAILAELNAAYATGFEAAKQEFRAEIDSRIRESLL